jgi:NDP-sugar pyrophosphorylase family protein
MNGGKLVILAGGISSRMKESASEEIDLRLAEEADAKAKSMIGVGDNYRPFLDYLLFNARQTDYEDILIVIGGKDESIRNYYGRKDRDNDFSGLKISYCLQKIPHGREKPLGTADALYQGLRYREDWKNKRFTVCNSDNLYSQTALRLLLNTGYRNAMIDYDRRGLDFDLRRIETFAVTKKDEEGYLTDIIEKPSEEEIISVTGKEGIIGVSMNIFCLQYDMIMPFLEAVPINEQRKEKELPQAVKMMIKEFPKSLYAYPLKEHVPDLTKKEDIVPIQKYLKTHYPDIFF